MLRMRHGVSMPYIVRRISYKTAVGFKEAKQRVIVALLAGTYQHEIDRSSIDTKNLLLTGQVTAAEICEVVKRSQGQNHSSSPHHHVPGVEVHVIARDGWYVKFYFVDPDTIFISVHQ